MLKNNILTVKQTPFNDKKWDNLDNFWNINWLWKLDLCTFWEKKSLEYVDVWPKVYCHNLHCTEKSVYSPYHCSEVKQIGKFRNHFPFEFCVPNCTLIKVTTIDKDNIAMFIFQIIYNFLESCHSSKTFFIGWNANSINFCMVLGFLSFWVLGK